MNLKELIHYLKEHSIEHFVIEAPEEASCRIEFPLNPDHLHRERSVQLNIQEQDLVEDRHYTFHFTYRFPFETNLNATSEIARYTAFLNTHQEFPGFTYDEINQTLTFRILQYALHSPQTILSILGMFLLTLDLFTPQLEKIAKGLVTMNETLEEMVATNE